MLINFGQVYEHVDTHILLTLSCSKTWSGSPLPVVRFLSLNTTGIEGCITLGCGGLSWTFSSTPGLNWMPLEEGEGEGETEEGRDYESREGKEGRKEGAGRERGRELGGEKEGRREGRRKRGRNWLQVYFQFLFPPIPEF